MLGSRSLVVVSGRMQGRDLAARNARKSDSQGLREDLHRACTWVDPLDITPLLPDIFNVVCTARRRCCDHTSVAAGARDGVGRHDATAARQTALPRSRCRANIAHLTSRSQCGWVGIGDSPSGPSTSSTDVRLHNDFAALWPRATYRARTARWRPSRTDASQRNGLSRVREH